MKTVAQLLQISEHDHSMFILDTYLIWCEAFAEDEKDLQKLMANTKLFQYWISVYRTLEDDFLWKVKDYEDLDKDTIWDFYNNITTKITKYYSKPLINKALKTKDYEYRSN